MWILRVQILDGTRQSNTHRDTQHSEYVTCLFLLSPELY